jgi:hypothetical protein
MTIRFRCPCGHTYAVPEAAVGRRGICRTCGSPLAVPMPSCLRDPDAVRDRLRRLRLVLHGDDLRAMARRLGMRGERWDALERGAPLGVKRLRRIIAATGVEPAWLLVGTGAMFPALVPADR